MLNVLIKDCDSLSKGFFCHSHMFLDLEDLS